MALETLKGVNSIGDFKIVDMDALREKYPEKFNESGAMDYEWFEKEIRPTSFIYIRHYKNSISFTIQNGGIAENGINGCQVDSILEVVYRIISGLNGKHPCRENLEALQKIDDALRWLKTRTENRTIRGVEGHEKD